MKKQTSPPLKSETGKGRKKSPENKDNLDSRKNQEQDFKGDDVTHNKKPEKNKKPRTGPTL